MEALTIALLAAVLLFLLWDRWRQDSRWRQQSDALSRTVGERIADTTRVFGEVQEGLGRLTKGTEKIEEVGRDIASLQEVLRAPKLRGGIGELMLERLLEDTLPRQHYALQHRFASGEAVDAVIRIGGNLVPVDSKFPLEDFQRILAATAQERAPFRRQFSRTVKKHVDAISRYILPDEGTFDFALMYIPAENVYYETILCDGEHSDLQEYALRRRVIPVSPNSFYAYLQVIILGLKGLHVEHAAAEILRHLERLRGDLGDFQEDFGTLGGHIRHAANKYDEAGRKLDRFGDRLRLAGDGPGASSAGRLPGHPEHPGEP